MKSNRRDLLLGAPLSLLALETLLATRVNAAPAATQADNDALHFWLNGAGLPSSLIHSADSGALREAKSKGAEAGPGIGSFAREPVFLHWDEQQNKLVDVTEIDKKMLSLPAGDAKVDLQLQRLRLNGKDQQDFEHFTSGAIYVELQQKEQKNQSKSSSDSEESVIRFASTVFSAFFPASKDGGEKGVGKKGAGKKGVTAPEAKKTQNPSGSEGNSPARAGSPVPLQAPRDAQSLVLPKGSGIGLFNAFVKDRKKTAFGQFITALVGSSDSSTYSPLMSISLIAAPALMAVRAIVSNLQLHESNQAIVMQAPRVELAATIEALSQLSDRAGALPLRTGNYIAIPREHVALVKNDLDKYQILNGFLVPKGTKNLDLTPEMARNAAAGVSYISLGVKVAAAKAGSCSVPKT